MMMRRRGEAIKKDACKVGIFTLVKLLKIVSSNFVYSNRTKTLLFTLAKALGTGAAFADVWSTVDE